MNFLLRKIIIIVTFIAFPLCASNKDKKSRPVLGEFYPAMQDYVRAMQSYNRNNDLIKLRQNFIDFLNAYPHPIKPLQMNGMVGMYAALKDLDSNHKIALSENGKKRLRELWDWTRNAILIETREMISFLHETDNPVYAHVCWELMNNKQRKHFIANGHKYKAYKILSEDCAQEFGQQTKQGATTAYTKIAKEKKPQEDTPFTFLNRNFESIMSRNTTPKDRTTHLLVFLEILNTKDFPELGIADNDKAQEYEHCFAQFITMSTFKNLFGNRCTLLALYNIQKVQNRLVVQMKSMAESGIAVPSFAACRAKVTCCTQQDIDQAVLAHPNFNALITRYQAVPAATAAATAISTSQQAEQKKEKELDPLERLFSCLDTYARAITSANPVAATAQYEADFIEAINNYTTPQEVDVSLELTTIVKYFSALKHIESHDSFKPNAKKIIKELRDCYKLMIGKYDIVKLMENVQSIVEADGILELMNTTERRKFSRQGNHTRGYALLNEKYPDKFKLELKDPPMKTAVASAETGSAGKASVAAHTQDVDTTAMAKIKAEKIKQLNEDTNDLMATTLEQWKSYPLEITMLTHFLYKNVQNSKELLTTQAFKKVQTLVDQSEGVLRNNQSFLIGRLSSLHDSFAIESCWHLMTQDSKKTFLLTAETQAHTVLGEKYPAECKHLIEVSCPSLGNATTAAIAPVSTPSPTHALDISVRNFFEMHPNNPDIMREQKEIISILESGSLEFKIEAIDTITDFITLMIRSFNCFCVLNHIQRKETLSPLARKNIEAFKIARMRAIAEPINSIQCLEESSAEKNCYDRFADFEFTVREYWQMMNEKQKSFLFYQMKPFYKIIEFDKQFPDDASRLKKGENKYWISHNSVQRTLKKAIQIPDAHPKVKKMLQPIADNTSYESIDTLADQMIKDLCMQCLTSNIPINNLIAKLQTIAHDKEHTLFLIYAHVKKICIGKKINSAAQRNGTTFIRLTAKKLKIKQAFLLEILPKLENHDFAQYCWELMDDEHKKEFIKNGAKAIPYKFLSEKYPEQFSHSAAASAAASTATVVPPKVTQARKPTPQEIHETKAKQEKLAAQERDRKIKMADDFYAQHKKQRILRKTMQAIKQDADANIKKKKELKELEKDVQNLLTKRNNKKIKRYFEGYLGLTRGRLQKKKEQQELEKKRKEEEAAQAQKKQEEREKLLNERKARKEQKRLKEEQTKIEEQRKIALVAQQEQDAEQHDRKRVLRRALTTWRNAAKHVTENQETAIQFQKRKTISRLFNGWSTLARQRSQETDQMNKKADAFAQQQAKPNAIKALKRSVKETYASAVNNALKALQSSCKEIQEFEKAIKPARLSTLKQQVTPFGHAQDLSTILDWRNQAEFIWAAQWNRLLLQAHNAYDATRILAESHESYTELASDSQSMELIARSHALLHGIANYNFIGKDAQAMARKFMMPNQSTKHYKQKFNFVPAGEMRKFNFLLSAVRAQDKDLVDRLSQENPADLNAVNGYRAGPLFCAVAQNSDLMVKYLLFRNARVGNKALTVADTEIHNLLTTAAQKTNKELDV